jgi:pimeloyl-ACP methyl ester carboxylesterase
MGKTKFFLFIFLAFSALFACLKFELSAVEVHQLAPRLLDIPPETYDYLVVAVWNPPPTPIYESIEYKAQAAIDKSFTKIASQSSWLKTSVGGFILRPMPIGIIYVRVGAKIGKGEEIYWSRTVSTEQKGSHPYISPLPLPTVLPVPLTLDHRPIIFVHGLGERPSDWENKEANRDYVGLLEGEGFNRKFFYLYSYADYNNDGVYDYEGDINGIASDLPRVVENLSQRSEEAGGDGKVDIVAFSLGGLISRAYFASSSFSHKIGKFIDIATPHQGVYLGEVVNFLDSIPFRGPAIRRAFLRFMSKVWNLAREGQEMDFNSPSAQQVIPESEFLTSLNQAEKTPKTLHYYCLYGDIHLTLRQKFFRWTLRSKKFSVGDLIMTPESATGVPENLCQGFGFIDEEDFEVKMIRGKLGPFLEIVAPIESLRFWHGNMIKQPEVKDKVLDLLE